MAKVYISCHHPDPADELAAVLEAVGHTVVSTWHRSTDPRPAKGDAVAWGNAANRNAEQIEQSTVFVLVASPDHIAGTKHVPGGKFVEAGYALGLGVITGEGQRPGPKVFTVGGVENGMLHMVGVTHVADAAGLVAALGK